MKKFLAIALLCLLPNLAQAGSIPPNCSSDGGHALTYSSALNSFSCTLITLFSGILPVCLVWGIGLYTWGYFHDKPFDISLFFNSIGLFLLAFGGFLLTGGGSLLLKKSTEPNNEPKKDTPP